MIRLRQIKVPIINDNKDVVIDKVCNKLKISKDDIFNFNIIKKSIDARDKNNILYVYEVDIEIAREDIILKHNRDKDIIKSESRNYEYSISGNKKLNNRIVIVGSGPSGLFCAYMLAEAGFKPIVLERGEKMEDRVRTVCDFFENNNLNVNSNIQFGEGGAGTFSDGKLNTLVKDKLNRGKKVFEIFVENGAPSEIMYLQKPHIGTDILRNVIVNMRNKIIALGGEFFYNSTVTDILVDDNKINGVIINNQNKLFCDVLVLAIGHSARDTFLMLHKRNLAMKNKNFAVGVRIEHPQEMINRSQYGDYYKLLPPASYKLVYQCKNGKSVYSFCMCPGGYVVNASSELNRLAINGMSNYNRDGNNANSAIVVNVGSEDYGDNLFDGLEFQRKLEEAAYKLGKGFIPIQLYKDFVNGVKTEKIYDVIPNTKGNYSFADLNLLFPKIITDSLKEAIPYFGTKIKGFDRDDAILLGVESRTSSPIIIERDEDGVSSISGIYPCGEGCGYAGGITTAAIDGIKVFEKIISMYKF